MQSVKKQKHLEIAVDRPTIYIKLLISTLTFMIKALEYKWLDTKLAYTELPKLPNKINSWNFKYHNNRKNERSTQCVSARKRRILY